MTTCIQHTYCVARDTCRHVVSLFSTATRFSKRYRKNRIPSAGLVSTHEYEEKRVDDVRAHAPQRGTHARTRDVRRTTLARTRANGITTVARRRQGRASPLAARRFGIDARGRQNKWYARTGHAYPQTNKKTVR